MNFVYFVTSKALIESGSDFWIHDYVQVDC